MVFFGEIVMFKMVVLYLSNFISFFFFLLEIDFFFNFSIFSV